MSKKDMLGPITRATIAAPTEHHGLILDVANKLGGKDANAVHKRIAQALRGEPISKRPSKVKVESDIVRVDRCIRPVYPDWADEKWINGKECMALEKAGPSEYSLQSIEQWLHDRQKNGGWCKGQVIYDYLTAADMLEGCLGLADLLEIQKLGIETFRKHFAGNAVFGWKSVVRDRNGDLNAPYLVEDGGQVELRWRWLVSGWSGSDPALRFAS